MKNRFDKHSMPSASLPSNIQQVVSQRETPKLDKVKISAKAYNTLMCLLATVPETPTTEHGVFVANSTKRNLQLQVRELFHHD